MIGDSQSNHGGVSAPPDHPLCVERVAGASRARRGQRRGAAPEKGVWIMLGWTIAFLVVAIIAALFGFTGIAAGAASIAKVLFFIFIVLFLLSLIMSLFRRGSTTVRL